MDDPLERFAGVYDQYYRNVLRYLLQHAEQGTAEDVASETFLIAWRRFPAIPDPPLPWLLGVARNLLTGPSRPGTRAAIYRLLAAQPGLSSAPGVIDPLGRVGIAIGAGGGDYLIIQPRTAELLAYTSHPVRAGAAMAASDGVEVYERFGWSNRLGVRP
jgi:hypothetical protein